jgi:hypothetical protein
LLSDIDLKREEKKRDKKKLVLNFIRTNKINLKEVNEELLYLGGYKEKITEQKQRKTFLKGLESEEIKR